MTVNGKFAYFGNHVTKTVQEEQYNLITEETETVEKEVPIKHGSGRWFRFPYLHIGDFANGNIHGKGRLYQQKAIVCPGVAYDFAKHDQLEGDFQTVLQAPEDQLANLGYVLIHEGMWKANACVS